MPYLILKYNGSAFAAITGGKIADLQDHIRNGYPHLEEVHGDITGEESDTIPLLSPPPVTETSEITPLSNWKTLFRVLVWMVNEIRGLQGKQPITRQQALSAIAALQK